MIHIKMYVRQTKERKEKWVPGVIVTKKGPNSYLVRNPGNNRRFVHANHLRHNIQEFQVTGIVRIKMSGLE